MAMFRLHTLMDILSRFWKFILVGASGVVVNMGLLYIFRRIFCISLYFSGFMAIEISIITNFILNDIWTWQDKHSRSFWGRFWRYNFLTGITAFGLNYPVLLVLTNVMYLPYMWSNLIGIALASAGNFVLNHFWTYRK